MITFDLRRSGNVNRSCRTAIEAVERLPRKEPMFAALLD
jgi:hypothetical protein